MHPKAIVNLITGHITLLAIATDTACMHDRTYNYRRYHTDCPPLSSVPIFKLQPHDQLTLSMQTHAYDSSAVYESTTAAATNQDQLDGDRSILSIS